MSADPKAPTDSSGATSGKLPKRPLEERYPALAAFRASLRGEPDGAADAPSAGAVENVGDETAADGSGTPARHVLAVCLIIVDALPMEEVWRSWARPGARRRSARPPAAPAAVGGGSANGGAGNGAVQGDPPRGAAGAAPAAQANAADDGEWEVQFFVHAKYPERITSPWLRRQLLPVTFRPEWGSIQLVEAMEALIDAALGEPRTARLVLASESCVPVCSLQEAVDAMCDDPNSWLRTRIPGAHGRSSIARVRAVDKSRVPPECICKADQWFLLTRRHAEVLTKMRAALDMPMKAPFVRVEAADEFVIPTLLATAGCLDLTEEHKRRDLEIAIDSGLVAVKQVVAKESRKQRQLRLLAEKKARKAAAAADAAGKPQQPATGAATAAATSRVPAAEATAGGATNVAATVRGSAATHTAPCGASKDGVSRRRVTMADWQAYWDMHPATFTAFDAAVVGKARAEGALFARRVVCPDGLTADEWKAVIEGRPMARRATKAAVPDASGTATEEAGAAKRKRDAASDEAHDASEPTGEPAPKRAPTGDV